MPVPPAALRQGQNRTLAEMASTERLVSRPRDSRCLPVN